MTQASNQWGIELNGETQDKEVWRELLNRHSTTMSRKSGMSDVTISPCVLPRLMACPIMGRFIKPLRNVQDAQRRDG